MTQNKIAIERIATGYHPRQDVDGKEELKRSIEKEGLLDPILVRPVGDGYILIDGLLRLLAIKELGWEEVDCIIIEVDEQRAAHLSFVRNCDAVRQSLTAMEESHHIKWGQDQYEYSINDLVELGCHGNQATIYNKLSLLKLPEEIQQQIADGTITPTAGYRLAKLNGEESQAQLAEKIVSNPDFSTRKIKEEVDSLIGSKKESEKKFSLTIVEDIEKDQKQFAPAEIVCISSEFTCEQVKADCCDESLSEKVSVKNTSIDTSEPDNKIDGSLPLNTIILGDCLEKLKGMPDDSVDLNACDPPYGLKFMRKDWDKALPSVEIWREVFRVLKPGGFSFIMCSSYQSLLARTIINIENEGFDVSSSSLYWAYAKCPGKTSPISLTIDKRECEKALTKKLGRKPTKQESDDAWGKFRKRLARNPNSRENCDKSNTVYESGTVGKTLYITEPATEEAKRWDGAYPGFNPRILLDVIIVARKPLDKKTYTDQALSNGKGVTFVDSCRIPYSTDKDHWHQNRGIEWSPERKWDQDCERQSHKDGRVPSNLLVSDQVLGDHSKYGDIDLWFEKLVERLPEEIQKTFPILIVKKSSQDEKGTGLAGCKNTHPTIKPVELMSYLIEMASSEGEVVLDPFCGSGTTCVAAKMLNRKYIGIEKEPEYHAIAEKRVKSVGIKSAT